MNLVFTKAFNGLTDPRIERKKLYQLNEILLVALATILCGGETYADMKLFGISKLSFFKALLPFKNGIPSDDTFERVFELLNPKEFQKCFSEWANSLTEQCPEILSIDGKTLTGSAKRSRGIKPLHIVEVWASKNRLVLGNHVVDEKSNEITAIPEVLKLLSLEGTIVTIDAMGCQLAIAQQIVENKGDFILSLKENQRTLHDDVRTFFTIEAENNFKSIQCEQYKTIEKGHGRLETRIYGLCSQIDWLKKNHPKWTMIKSIGFVTSTRRIGDKKTTETRYYITSLKSDVERFAEGVRGHWGIENLLHGMLDVSFKEDSSKVRNKNAAENLAVIRRLGVNLVELTRRQQTAQKISKKGIRLKAGWSDEYLKCVLTQQF